jgi:small subunit ribosomal protein S8
MLTRIRNAINVRRPHVDIPSSKLKRGLAEVLKREGYIWDWQEVEAEPTGQLRLELKYGANGEEVIQNIKRISTPGRRVYRKARDMRPVLGGMGITIVSTSSGIFSDREARQKNIGGEVLCEIY